MNILYVEDDPRDADLTRREFAKSAPRFRLDTVATQREALAHLEGESPYDLVLTDLRLPDGDGLAVLAHVRERGLPLAVVVITGGGDEESAVSALKAGADGYVVKGGDYLARLPLALENALHRFRAEAARRAHPLRVLYAEHNASDVDLTRRHLARHAPHIHLDVVYSAPEVLQRLSKDRYDLILLDYQLPGMNALDVLKELAQSPGFDLPVVLVTGMGSEVVAVQALRLGADDYLVKNAGYLYQLPLVLENAFHRAQLTREQVTLRESETRYRLLAENVTDVIWIMDVNLRFTYMSPSVARMSGYSVEEAMALTMEDTLTPASLEVVMKTFAEEMAVEEMEQKDLSRATTLEVEQYCQDGSTIWTEVKVTGLRDPDGRLVKILGVTRNITERKQAEEEIKAKSLFLERLIQQSPLPTFVMDSKGFNVMVNEAFLKFYAVPNKEMILGRNALTEPANVSQGIVKYFEEAFSGKIVKVPEIEFVSPYENKKTITRCRMFPIVDPTGTLTNVVVVQEDITERARAAEERDRLLAQIQEQAHQVQQIIDTMPEGVLLLDTAGYVVLANRLGKKDLAALSDARVGDTLIRLGDRPLAELLTSPLTKGLWHEVTTDDRHFEVIARPLDAELESEDWVMVIRDVTQEREVQRQVQRQERLAAVGQLAGGIAHDFNNLLTTIILYAQIALGKSEHDLPPNATRAFEVILGESRLAAKLVQQILDFSRRSPIETSPVDLKPFIEEAVRVLERTIPESIHLWFDAEPEKYVVEADPTRIQQVLMNLVVNARDAMPEGGDLRIGLSRVETSPGEKVPVMGMVPGEWVCLAVSDTGTGIPPDVLPYLFEPFFTTKEPGKGTGLGLAQVHGIVAQHDGHIGVETEVGQGTTLRVYLPAYGAQVEITEEQVSVPPQGQGETILLVEDDENLRKGGRDLLELLGYRVLTAKNGREALEVYHAVKEIDLVVTDLVMPEMGGKRLMRELRKVAPGVKALVITGYVMRKDLDELREAGFLDIVYKPFDVDRMAQVVRRALDVD